jgi:uncharacterized protein (DUF4415 family)
MNLSDAMGEEYDFSKGKHGARHCLTGQDRITIMMDDDVIEAFRVRAEGAGTGSQALTNSALRDAVSGAKETPQKPQKPLTVATLRRILREELQAS